MATNLISPWLERLQRRFSPRRIRIGSDLISPLPGGESRAVLGVVGRELCLYLSVDAGKVPAKQRAAFVALAVRRAAPFADPEHGVAWLGDQAAVWYWSRARVLATPGLEPGKPLRLVPEALLLGAPEPGDRLQLLALSQGVEARAWKQGRLVASRWWPAPPADEAWHAFLRGAGLSATTSLPEAEPAPLRSSPWSAAGAASQAVSFATLDAWVPRALAAVALLATALASLQLGAIARALWETRQARAEAAALDAPLKRILAAREQVDRDQAQIAGLLALRAPRAQTTLLAEAARITPGKDWQLVQWQQPGPGQVEATLRLRRPNLERLVSQWEASPMFAEVSTETSGRNGEVTVKARIEPAQEASP